MTTLLPDPKALKQQAKRLRDQLKLAGDDPGHSRSLELLARQHGFRDWNTLVAASRQQMGKCPVRTGDTVEGAYMGQTFRGTVLSTTQTGDGRFRISLDFEEAVDVVAFDSFSAYRKRVKAEIDGSGTSLAKTSDGEPHLQLIL